MGHRQLQRPGLDPAVAASISHLAPAATADDTGCSVLHVDMDAFYASVSLLARPDLLGRPVLVGGAGTRGVVLSASYAARAAGVHSAMPMARALRLCPQAVVLPPDHERYAEVSAQVMDVLAAITPVVEPLGLDEAFLDVAGARRRLGSPATIAAAIRARVAEQVGVTCSIGVATTKAVAKLASGRCKPDGLLVVPAAATTAFLHPLPAGALWGVGQRTEEALTRLGLHTIGDIAHTPVATLRRALGEATGGALAELAWGRDARRVEADRADREHSTGAQETFWHDVDDPDVVRAQLLRLATRTASRARRAGQVGRTVVLTVRDADFTTTTRSRTLPEHTDLGRDVYAAAAALWNARADVGAGRRLRVRMVGVRLEGLAPACRVPRQLRLAEPDHGWAQLERAVDDAGARFGASAVQPAVLIAKPDRGRGTTPP